MKAPNMCILCKGGRMLCGASSCPLLKRVSVAPKIKELASDSFFGPSPSVFVGRSGYPDIFAGPTGLMTSESAADSPGQWFGMDYGKVIELRSMVLRTKSRENIFSKSRLIGEMQEIAMSSRPVDTEMVFLRKPSYRVRFSDVVQPMGPSAELKSLSIAENTPIDRAVERVVSDDLKAADASFRLYEKQQDIYKIMTILSSGALGFKKKLVPTRWSITAVDDILTKRMLADVRTFPNISDFQVFRSAYLDNHFQILLMPGAWEYEGFEAWAPGSFWSAQLKAAEIVEEYEPFAGRKAYADRQGGGYYAARLGVVEHLHAVRRQARVMVFREIREGYVVPLGVWVVRETVRNAFKNPSKKFATLAEALKHVDANQRIPTREYIKQSAMLKQRKITEF